MKRLRLLHIAVALTALSVIGTTEASATVINFDSLAPGIAVTNQFSGLGVNFANTTTASFIGATPSPPMGVRSTTGLFVPTQSQALVALFGPLAASSVSVLGLDLGESGARIDAYDALVGGNLIDTDSFFGTGSGAGVTSTIGVTSLTPIRRVEFYAAVVSLIDGIGFDNFTFTLTTGPTVPEPSTLAIFGLGLAGLGFMRRRRRAA